MDNCIKKLTVIICLLFIIGFLSGWCLDKLYLAAEIPTSFTVPQSKRTFNIDLAALDKLIQSLSELERELSKYNTLSAQTGLPEGVLVFIKSEAIKNGFNPSESLGKIQLESGFNPSCISFNRDSSGKIVSADIGLWQINSKTAPWLWTKVFPGIDYITDYEVAEGVIIDSRLLDPVINTRLGSWYHGYLLRQYKGDRDQAHTAYNRGERGLEKWVANRGTARSPYSERVLSLSGEWTSIDGL